MKLPSSLLSSFLSLTLVIGLHAESAPKTISIGAFDTMKFSVNKIEAAPGQKITIELKNAGTLPKEAMGHNWILLKAGSDARAYANQAVKAAAQDYQPPALAAEVVASIKLLGPSETGSVTFKAPMAPGSYPFLCSFPAHYQSGMKGVLVIK